MHPRPTALIRRTDFEGTPKLFGPLAHGALLQA
jgi:hypothetical protein